MSKLATLEAWCNLPLLGEFSMKLKVHGARHDIWAPARGTHGEYRFRPFQPGRLGGDQWWLHHQGKMGDEITTWSRIYIYIYIDSQWNKKSLELRECWQMLAINGNYSAWTFTSRTNSGGNACATMHGVLDGHVGQQETAKDNERRALLNPFPLNKCSLKETWNS